MAAIDERYKNSICEIKSTRNELLTTGRIYSLTDDTIEFIHPEEDKMPLLPFNMPVKVGVFNAKLRFRMLIGLVYISTDVFLRVTDVKMLQDFERRGFFRMPVRMLTRVYPIVEGEDATEEAARPIPITLEDVSLSGVQISTDREFQIRDTFAIEIQLFKKKLLFHCRIAREAKQALNDGRHYYGCAFFDHTERQMDDLCYDLFQLQRVEMRKRKSHN